ncbi:MAG: VWA domain-containing protein [Vicinamibacterales bacterium]
MPGRFIAGGAAALLFSISLFAQSNERIAYVSAWDAKTRAPLTGLGTDAFVVREDGARREVLRVTPATTPMAVAILVDNSQAVRDNISDIRRALTTFVRELEGVGPVAIVGVADRPTILRDYTTSQKELLDGVGKVFAMPDSGATLLDAIVEIGKGLEKRPEDRVAMVVLTTENTEFSTRHYSDVLEGLAKSGAMLHTVVLTSPNGSSLNDAARNRASVLDRGPRESGGTRADVLASQAFELKLKELAAILKSQHRVTYSRPQQLIPPEKFEITAAKDGVEANGAPARGQAAR